MKFIKTLVGFNRDLAGILTIFLVKMYTFVMVRRFIVSFFID